MNGESSINIYAPSGVRWIADEMLLYSTGSPVSCSVMAWRDGVRGGPEGGDVWLWLIHIVIWQKPNQHCKKKKRQPNFFSIACIKNLNSVIKKFCSVMQKRMEGMPKNYLLANIEQQPPLPRKPGSGVEWGSPSFNLMSLFFASLRISFLRYKLNNLTQ